MPIAVPTMPDSARGVSNTRVSPNAAASPLVIRNTPPSVPTSSPKTSTVSSSLRASESARFSAPAIVTACPAASARSCSAVIVMPRSCLLKLSQLQLSHLKLSQLKLSQLRGQFVLLPAQLRRLLGVDVPEKVSRIVTGAGVHALPQRGRFRLRRGLQRRDDSRPHRGPAA